MLDVEFIDLRFFVNNYSICEFMSVTGNSCAEGMIFFSGIFSDLWLCQVFAVVLSAMFTESW